MYRSRACLIVAKFKEMFSGLLTVVASQTCLTMIGTLFNMTVVVSIARHVSLIKIGNGSYCSRLVRDISSSSGL